MKRLDDDAAGIGLLREERARPGKIGRLGRSGKYRDAKTLRQGTRARLVAEDVQNARIRPDENEIRFLASPRKIADFTQKAVAWMNGIAVCRLCCFDQACTVKIRSRPRAFQGKGLVAMLDMKSLRIVFRIDSDGLEPEVVRGACNANGDLAPIGDENSLESHEKRVRSR